MIIVVNHQINNPGEFWNAAQNNLSNLPESGVSRVIQVLPNLKMTQAACLWEAESIAHLDKYLRSKVGDWSNETYFEVNTAQAMGLHS